MTQNEATITSQELSDQETSTEDIISHSLSFALECIRPEFCYATILIPSSLVNILYHEAARSQQKSTQTHGFRHGNVPIDYIKKNFTENLVEHLKELLLKYCVINFLYEQIRINKLVVAGEPRLTDMAFDSDGEAKFTFELSLFPELTIYEWKYFPFKAPKRKNYKDLDRQVESFIEEEKRSLQNIQHEELTIGDWVSFNISFVDENETRLLDNYLQNFWFKLGEDDTESPLRQLFIGKKMGERFCSNHQVLQEYFSNQLDTNYSFCIEITNILSHQYFCFDQFKRTFRIKTNKDMHKKLIEVFSYRNDISQRHAMVEEALRALLSKHRFSVPNYLVLRQQKVLLDRIKNNPDYQVYRAQKDFQNYVHDLAQKQVIEMIFIDKLAYHENLQLNDEDIKGYLNLINRPRMKEFIYFDVPSFKIQGQEVPIPTQEFIRTCLREKAINYVIYHLTKK